MIDTTKYFDQIQETDAGAFPKAAIICVAKVGSTHFVGWNSEKTSPSFMREYPCGNADYKRHAEMHVLKQIPKGTNPKSIKIYVSRIVNEERFSMAKPCRHCQERLFEFGINPRNVFFTDWDGKWTRMRHFNE